MSSRGSTPPSRRPRQSKRRWGWLAFGAGLALCVAAGAVVGVLMGTGGSRDRANEIRRVAALALGTSILNNDALALSRAIEGAIARDELETEGVALRSELSRIEARAARFQARANALEGAGRDAETVRVVSGGRAGHGLRAIKTSLAVLQREIVSGLDSVLASPPEELTANDALGEVMATLEHQEQTLAALAESLTEQDDEGHVEATATDDEEDLIAGSVPLLPDLAGEEQAFELKYELTGIDVEVDAAEGPPGKAIVTSSATGSITLTNTDSLESASFGPPRFVVTLLWEKPGVPPAVVRGDFVVGVAESVGEMEREPCRFELHDKRYCALVGIELEPTKAESRDVLLLDPEESIDLGAAAASELWVASGTADAVSDFLGSNKPDLVWIEEAEGATYFTRACTAAGESTIGLLRGDGRPIFVAEERKPTSPDAETWRVEGADSEVEERECFEESDG